MFDDGSLARRPGPVPPASTAPDAPVDAAEGYRPHRARASLATSARIDRPRCPSRRPAPDRTATGPDPAASSSRHGQQAPRSRRRTGPGGTRWAAWPSWWWAWPWPSAAHPGPRQRGQGRVAVATTTTPAPRRCATCPADRNTRPGRHGPGPAGPGRQDRQLHGRPALVRPQPGRHRVRGAGGGSHHPAGGGVPVPAGRRWSVTSVRPGSPTPASSPSSPIRSSSMPAASPRCWPCWPSPRSSTRTSLAAATASAIIHPPGGSPPTRRSPTPPRCGPSIRPTPRRRRRSSTYSATPARRVGGRFGAQRPHPVLVLL